jgi:hypothetical protein
MEEAELSLNFVDKEPKINVWFQKGLLFFGERLTIILFTLFVFGFAFFNLTQKVFSQDSGPIFVRMESKWFSKDVAFAVSTQPEDSSFEINAISVPTPTPTPVPVVKTELSESNDDVWELLADCESHKNWGANTGNGYYGGLQFSEGAWNSVGGTGLPSDAGRDEQIMRGKILQERRGWAPWGACSKKLSLQ